MLWINTQLKLIDNFKVHTAIACVLPHSFLSSLHWIRMFQQCQLKQMPTFHLHQKLELNSSSLWHCLCTLFTKVWSFLQEGTECCSHYITHSHGRKDIYQGAYPRTHLPWDHIAGWEKNGLSRRRRAWTKSGSSFKELATNLSFVLSCFIS